MSADCWLFPVHRVVVVCAALLSDSLDSQRFYVTRQSVCIIMRSQGVSRRANKRFLGFFLRNSRQKRWLCVHWSTPYTAILTRDPPSFPKKLTRPTFQGEDGWLPLIIPCNCGAAFVRCILCETRVGAQSFSFY